MHRLKFREFIDILLGHDFELHRHGASSHRRYRGIVDGHARYVDVAGHANEDIKPGTLASMIRQSGLPKRLFR